MSTNAPQVQQPQPDDPWTPRRVHGGFRHVRRVGRGRNRQYRFQGQLEGEVVKLVIRRHKLFLITSAFPLIASILGLIAAIALSGANPSGGGVWTFLELAAAAALLVTEIMFLYKNLALWWRYTAIITNKHVFRWTAPTMPPPH